MKFSIITPSLNQGRFIRDCIESVLDQKKDEFEVEHIIIDAGSTDETIEVLKRYPHLTWVSEPDRGMSDGINKGFQQASGDWLMWLNCDDYLLPGTLAKVAAFALANPDADLIHGDCVFVTEDRSVIRRKYDTQLDEWDLLFVGCIIPSTSCFLHRKIIDADHLLDLNYKNCMDREYYLRLQRNGYKFNYLPEALAHFRWHEESTTLQNWQRMIDERIRCQHAHIQERGLPNVLKNGILLKILRRFFQVRRMGKRILAHGRIY